MNGVESMLTESLTGFAKATIIVVARPRVSVSYCRQAGEDGGGALFRWGSGTNLAQRFIGSGMWSRLPGNMFTSPTPDQVLAHRTSDCAAACSSLENYAGDHEFSSGPKCTQAVRHTHHG